MLINKEEKFLDATLTEMFRGLGENILPTLLPNLNGTANQPGLRSSKTIL